MSDSRRKAGVAGLAAALVPAGTCRRRAIDRRLSRGCIIAAIACTVVWPIDAGALPRAERQKLEPRPGEPGSGVRGKRRRPAQDAKLQAPLPSRPKDETESEGLDTMERLLARYRRGHAAVADTVATLLTIRGAEGRRSIESHYDRQIREHHAKARKLRAVTIRRYEDFLELHPDEPTWTPEIMFRLAELHVEGANERLTRQEEAYQKELEVYQAQLEDDAKASAPVAPSPEFGPAVALYRDVILRFPDFHLGDAALYMLGTLYYEMEEFDHSRQSYLALACHDQYEPPLADGSNLVTPVFKAGDYEKCKPWKLDSRYATEAWLRVGEVHYDFDELDQALEAYAQALEDPEGDLYDEALIRMAWTLYLKRDFTAAAKRLDEFVLFADKAKDKQSGAVALRDDAVRYLAKTYVEEDWDGDGKRDRVWGFDRLDADYRGRKDEPHVPEVYAALGDLFAYQTDFAAAIGVWETALNRWPLAPAAPSIQMRILQAWNALQEKDRASEARDKLATDYLRGSKWFYANESDPDAIEAALKLAEEALVHTALDHHARAQALRAEGDPKAEQEYAIAARAYQAFLERYPDTASSYEYRYNLGEALYYSGNYLAAAEAYGEVRDSNLDNRLQEDAAAGMVSALEAHAEAEQKRGALTVPDMPKEGAKGPFGKPKKIPEVMRALQAAYDRFAEVRPDSKQTPAMMFRAGAISQRYHHFKDAERRFVAIIDTHCDDNVAINAGQAILDAHIVRDDLKGAKSWTEKLAQRACGEGDEASKFAGELKSIGNAVRFQEATLLYEAGEFEAAADRYVALVDEAPDDKQADRALFNGAVAYESIGRFNSASQTYKRIYTNYPDSEFADDALLRTGYNHSKFFEFDEAVTSYLILAEDPRYKDSEHREIAVKNAASLLDNLQQYQRSAEMYGRFAAKSEDREKSAEAAFLAAKVVSKTGDHRATIRVYGQFVTHYGTDVSQAERVVEAHLRVGQAHAALGNRNAAEASYRTALAEFASRGLQPASDAADFPSEAQFLLAEAALEDVMRTKLTSTNGKKLAKEAETLFNAMNTAVEAYKGVLPYRRIEWILAAMYRSGQAFETTAINMRAAPVPRQLKQYSEAWFAYQDIVTEWASKYELTAIKYYEETLARAKSFSVANVWTKSARERLNIYKPQEYPLLRDPALDFQLERRR